MTAHSIEQIVEALNRGGTRYLVVGGLAVVAHGFVRFTADLDLVLDPDSAAMRRAIGVLSDLGYRPRAPVAFADFAAPERRQSWAREKQLVVFSVFSDAHPATEIDLFLEPPFDFERAYSKAVRFEVGPGITGSFVSREDLIEMKRKAGRTQDLADVAGLEQADAAGGNDG
jgi:hypothetical protein